MKRFLSFLMLCSVLLGAAPSAFADRPHTLKILPDWTIGLVHVRDASEFKERMSTTGFAQMLADPEIQPFVQHLYGSATDLAEVVEERIGLTIEQVLAIPEKEITLAFCAPPGFQPAPVFIFDLPKVKRDIDALLEEGVTALKNGGYSLDKQTHEGTEMDVFSGGDEGPDNIIRFTKDDTLVVTTNLKIAERMLELWSGRSDEETIMDNQAFKTIAARCEMGEETRSHMMWFVDPVGIAKAVTRGNFAAAAGLSILPAIGLDGFHGIGGSVVMPEQDYESINHWHLYLENPRDGVLEMITLKDGDNTPESWVPANVINYVTVHLDMQKTYSLLKDLIDSFRGEGAVAEFVKDELSENIGLDVEQDFIAQIEGRLTLVQVYEEPARLNSQSTMIGIKMRDRERFEGPFKDVMKKFSDNIESANIKGIEVFRMARGDNEDFDELDQENTERRRRRRRQRELQPQPSFALMGDYLILADRPSTIELLIDTKEDPDNALANSIEFKQVMQKIARQPNGQTASMISFSRPAEALKMFYELARSDDAKNFLGNQRDENPVLAALDDAMTEHPLPAFEKLEKYFTPAGSMISNEETGIHQIGFSLRIDEAE